MATIFQIQFIHRALNFFNRKLIGPIAKYIFLILHLNLKYRFLNTNHAAIGHICIDVDCFLREKSKGIHSFCGVLLANRSTVANQVLSRLWRKNLGIVLIENPLACFALDYLRTYSETSFDCSNYTAINGQPAKAHEIYGSYSKIDPIISWDWELYKKASEVFKRHFPGVNANKIVALHVRDSFFDRSISNHNFYSQKYRNSDINSYQAILSFLVQHGYTAIRIGEYEKIKSTASNLYAELTDLCKFDRDLINVFISSRCALFLGSASGPPGMGAIWNRPIFVLNILPYAALRQVSPNSMGVPKLLSIDGRVLGAREIFKMEYYNLADDALYKKFGIMTHTNDPLDCLPDFKSFFNAFVYHDESAKYNLIKSPEQLIYKENCPKNSYDYYSQALVPKYFFKKYDILK